MTASLSNLIPPCFYYLANLVSVSETPVFLKPRSMVVWVNIGHYKKKGLLWILITKKDDHHFLLVKGATMLANGIEGNSTLNELHISNTQDDEDTSTTESRWCAICTALNSPMCTLETNSNNIINDATALSLVNALYRNPTLLKTAKSYDSFTSTR